MGFLKVTVACENCHSTVTSVTLSKKIRTVIAISLLVLLLCLNSEGEVFIIGAFIGMNGHLLKGAAEMGCQCLSELFGCLGKAVIVVMAPCPVNIVDAACCSGIIKLAF